MSKVKNNPAKAGLGYIIGNVLIKGISFVTLPIFTRIMSLEAYGKYSVYLSYETIFTVFLGLCMYSSLRTADIQFKGKINEYVSSVVVVPIIIAAGIILVSFGFRAAGLKLLGLDEGIFIMLVLHSLSTCLLSFYNIRVSIDFEYIKYVVIALTQTLGNVAVSLFLMCLVFKDNSYYGRVVGTAVPIIGIGVYILFYFFSKAKPKINKEYIKFGLKFSLPLLPHGLAQTLLAQFGRLSIERNIGAFEAGIFSYALTISIIPQIIITSIETAYSPWFFQNYKKEKNEYVNLVTRGYITLFSIAFVLMCTVLPEVVKIMSDKSYWVVIDILLPVTMSSYFIFLYNTVVQIEYYEKKTAIIGFLTAAVAVLNVILCEAVTRHMDYKAVAFVLPFCYLVYFIFHSIFAKKLSKSEDYKIVYMYQCLFVVSAGLFFIQYFIEKVIVRYSIAVGISLILLLLNKEEALQAGRYFKKTFLPKHINRKEI